MKDFQKNKVYSWEGKYVFPRMPKAQMDIPFLKIVCDHIWSEIGRVKPPRLRTYNRYKSVSTGGRYDIKFAPHMQTEYILVHEMAHSLNLCEDRKNDTFDVHGPNFVADYCALLVKFYKFDMHYLLWSLKTHGVKVNTNMLYSNLNKWS